MGPDKFVLNSNSLPRVVFQGKLAYIKGLFTTKNVKPVLQCSMLAWVDLDSLGQVFLAVLNNTSFEGTQELIPLLHYHFVYRTKIYEINLPVPGIEPTTSA